MLAGFRGGDIESSGLGSSKLIRAGCIRGARRCDGLRKPLSAAANGIRAAWLPLSAGLLCGGVSHLVFGANFQGGRRRISQRLEQLDLGTHRSRSICRPFAWRISGLGTMLHRRAVAAAIVTIGGAPVAGVPLHICRKDEDCSRDASSRVASIKWLDGLAKCRKAVEAAVTTYVGSEELSKTAMIAHARCDNLKTPCTLNLGSKERGGHQMSLRQALENRCGTGTVLQWVEGVVPTAAGRGTGVDPVIFVWFLSVVRVVGRITGS